MANGGRQIPSEDALADAAIRAFLAQVQPQPPDASRVALEPAAPQSEIENFIMNLIQGADPSMGVFSGMAGLTPDEPDLKTQILIGILTGGVGGLGALLRAGGRRVAGMGGAVARKLDPRPAMQELADIAVPFRKDIREGAAETLRKSTDDAVDELLQEFELFESLGGERLPTPLERANFFQGKLDEFVKANPDQNTMNLFERRKLLEGRAINAREIAEGAAESSALPETIRDIERLLGGVPEAARASDEAVGAILDQIAASGRKPGTAVARTTPPVRGEIGGGLDNQIDALLKEKDQIMRTSGGLSPAQNKRFLEIDQELEPLFVRRGSGSASARREIREAQRLNTPGNEIVQRSPGVRGELGGTGTGVSSSFQDMTMGELVDLVESSIKQVEIDEAAFLRSRFRPSGEIPQGGSGVGRASRAIGSGSRDIESIREQIFRDILERGGGDPFGEAEGIHEGIMEQIQRLIQRRLGN